MQNKHKHSWKKDSVPTTWLPWKKRKHRKGNKPQKTGVLKVNIIQLPTDVEHTGFIDQLFEDYNEVSLKQNDIMMAALKRGGYFSSLQERYLFDLRSKKSREILDNIGRAQKGYNYFRNYRQCCVFEIAFSFIMNDGISLNTEKKLCDDTCQSCALSKGNCCPYDSIKKTGGDIKSLCPFLRQVLYNALKTPPKPLNQQEIAKTAVQIPMS